MVEFLLLFSHIIEWIGFGIGVITLLFSTVIPWRDNAMPIGGLFFIVGSVLTVVLGLLLFFTGGF